MKKSYILIALAMLAALTVAGCKNNRKNQNQEPTQEEIQAQKQALADSVLTKIDALAEQYIDAKSQSFSLQRLELTETEKMVKPNYLLDPSDANKFVTKSQKINALAIYYLEKKVRILYDMPVDEANEVITRLAAELNYPLDYDMQHLKDIPVSQRFRTQYEKCKENGDIADFWQFHEATITELNYLVAQNPDLFFSRITEEQWKAFYSRKYAAFSTIKILAEYDEEMASLLNSLMQRPAISNEKLMELQSSVEFAKQFHKDNRDKYTAVRNALLQ